MTDKLKGVLIAGGAIVALAAGGAAIASATGWDDHRTPIPAGALDRARAVALDRTGGGRVTATEVRDEEGYYEVEVKRGDGSQVDVHLDRNLKVLDASPDGRGEKRDANNR